MNRLFTSTILALAFYSSATAQTSNNMSQPQDPNEVVVLSSYVDGNYNVERLLVMESSPNNNEFVMRYKINLTKLISTYDNNSAEIEGLHNFIESIQKDSLKRITRYDIVGYASPDGPAALNERLANERANDFSQFVDMECDMSDYPRSVSGKPYMWIDTKEAIEKSTVPDKKLILAAIESNKSQSAIETTIKGYDKAWEYIKSNTLPPMRSVEIHIKYNSWKVVENRTLIEVVEPDNKAEIEREKRRQERRKEPIDDYINCIFIEMPDLPIDFDENTTSEKLKINKHSAKLKEIENGIKTKEKIKKGRQRRR